MKKNLLLCMVFLGASFAGIVGVRAITPDEIKAQKEQLQTDRKTLQEQKLQSRGQMQADKQVAQEERVQKKEEMVAEKCSKVQERIATRIDNFDDNKDKHMAVYKNMIDRISKFIDKLSGEGYDVSKVKADLEVLKGKIAKFSTDKDARLAKLNETKDFACGKSDGEFKSKLTDARASLQLVHADAMDIRKYMLSTVRPDIQALRAQKVEAKKAAPGTTDDTKAEKPELE